MIDITENKNKLLDKSLDFFNVLHYNSFGKYK